ncbi:MAG: dihydroxyacetone kinase subunit DhaK [Planctomycetaceae bacterium]|nr:dihydroxyacetone kinase subunit DhaK [Planctomycetaceae bacterium]
MKKLINDPSNVVTESLAGFQAAHADLVTVSYDPMYVCRKEPNHAKVAVISGGGSGHEPMHSGYIGYGMLDAACPGNVFTSPTPDQVEAAARAVGGPPGVLLLVKNYTGDVMNFEMAVDMLGGEFPVETVVIDDDVAVQDSLYTAGRRGVGLTVLMEKLCGAAAERGDDLAAVKALAEQVRANGRSMGLALTSCTVPAAGTPPFDLGPNDIEMGVGIHGEPGRERQTIRPADELVETMFKAVTEDIPFKSGDDFIVMVNGMGGTPLIELYLCYNRVAELCRAKNFTISRCLVGNYITALEMQGMSLTMLRATPEMLKLWDAPVHTPGLRWGK